MATTGESVPFALDGSSLSPVHDAVSGVGALSVIEMVALAVGLAVVIVGIAGVLSRVRSATESVDAEIAELTAERDAFHEFATEIDELPVTRGATAVSPQAIHAVDDRGPPVDAVRTAYETTVMAVDHYEETYDEPWLAHLASELDEELAVRLDAVGTVTAPVQRALFQHALEAARQRDGLVDVLTGEREAVADAADTLTAVQRRLEAMDDRPLTERPFDELASTYESLTEERSQLQRLGERRQRQIRRDTRHHSGEDEPLHLQAYLYGGPPGQFPVLAGVAALSRRVESARHRVVSALTATA